MTSALPSLPRLGFGLLLRAGLKRGVRTAPAELPAPLHSVYQLDRIDLAHVARYRAFFGFAADGVPLTYFYLLAQRAHMATMLQPAFPFRIAGMVHVTNGFERLAEVDAGRPLRIETELRIEPPGARGQVYVELETRFSQEGIDCVRCTSRYLAVRGRKPREAGRRPPPVPVAPVGEALAEWPLASHTGRAYAALSGDWNPIHLAGWSARLMGLRQPIIHGMHTLARAAAALEARALQAGHARARTLMVQFRAPVVLPGRASLHESGQAGVFRVHAGADLAAELTLAD